MTNQALEGMVAVVAGATRGAGRGIATALGEAGATVYCTGRSTREKVLAERSPTAWGAFELAARAETIEDTADLVTAKGGKGIAVRCDHTIEADVRALFDRVRAEQGRLDILVNDVWGGDELTEWGKPFWELSLDKGLTMLQRAINTHIITAHHAAPLMIESGGRLLVEITDGEGYYYRGSLFYDLVKTTIIRLAFDLSNDLKKHGIAAVAVTPGFLRSEAMLEHFGVTEANWQDAATWNKPFAESETPLYVGRAVAALAADPKIMEKSGRVYSTWTLMPEYGFTDADGRQPHFVKWLEQNQPQHLNPRADDTFYSYWNVPNYEDLS